MRPSIPLRLVLLAGAHFTIDSYSSFFSPLLPLLVAKLHLSLTLVGTLVALASITSSFAQPAFGWLADRMHRPWFVVLGPLVAAVFMSAIGHATSFASLAALLMLGGLGVSSFHPQAAVLASESASRRSLAMSTFVSAGSLGMSMGPLFAVALVGAVGVEGLWMASFLGLATCAVLATQFRRLTPGRRPHAQRPALRELKPVLRPLTLLYLAVVCRSAVGSGFMTFLPLLLHARGYTVGVGGTVLAVYLLSGAAGGFFGGWLSDRVGPRRVLVQSYVGAIPLYFVFLFVPGLVGIAALVVGSFVLMGSLPVNVVLGQELSPRHSSTISSLLMGAAWGVGSLLIGPVGALADARGLVTALAALTALLVGGLLCVMSLPSPRLEAPMVELAQPGAAGT